MRRIIITWNIIAPLLAIALLSLDKGWWALAVIFSAHSLWLWATLIPSCQWFGPVITSFSTAQNEVWLTIDDGPDPVETPLLLELLDRHQAKATFFFIGTKAAQYPELVRSVLRRGHGIGNHTMTHPAAWFWAYLSHAVKGEIIRCNEMLYKITGDHPKLFRAPAGLKNGFVHRVLSQHQMALIGWSVRGFDGVRCDPARVLERLQQGIKPGAIILVHEGRGTSIEIVGKLLAWLEERGYRCVQPTLNTLHLAGD
jgi:peptidoglycan/xylan/chitin deacetylase (PgdA/CDA1 family)